jgi:hypothetical protein
MLVLIIITFRHAKADFAFGTPENLGPTVNSSSGEGAPSISSDGLTLYFTSLRSGNADLWITTRETTDEEWARPVSLGPTVNSGAWDGEMSISTDELELYFASNRSVGSGGYDLWLAKRASVLDPWERPVNLGPNINTSVDDADVCISADGLSLYIESYRDGGYGGNDLWVAKRATKSDQWEEPVNLGSTVNSSVSDGAPSITADGLVLFFSDHPNPRPGGHGGTDIWITRRATTSDLWGEPINLGPIVNSPSNDQGPNISSDSSTLYFFSTRSGGYGDFDLWQVSIKPILDLNSDGIIDCADMCIIIDHWGTDNTLCDIGPTPLGDGIVDVQDLIVLSEHLFEEVIDPSLIVHWTLNETEGMYAADSVGDNDAVVLGGIEWQPTGGQIDGALKLDGISGYAVAGAVLNPADGPFSVIAWVKGGAPGQVVLSQTGAANWLCTDSVEGYLMTELKKDFGRFEGDPLLSEAFIDDGNWHRIGFVWDGSCRHLYVDGVEVANDAEPLSGLNDAYGGLYIGTGSNSVEGTFFSGLIDDIRIYNRVVRP